MSIYLLDTTLDTDFFIREQRDTALCSMFMGAAVPSLQVQVGVTS